MNNQGQEYTRQPQSLPIWRDSQRLLTFLEQVVSDFPRYHKYALGSDLRRQALLIVRLLSRALNAPKAQRVQQVIHLQQSIDDIKIMIQTAKEIKAFKNFQQFQQAAELAVALGKQSGAWLRRLNHYQAQPEHGGN